MSMYSPSRDSSWLCAALAITLIHVGFLGFSIYWPSSPITTQKKTKVFVQTITLPPNPAPIDTTVAIVNSNETSFQKKPLSASIKKEPLIEKKQDKQPLQEPKTAAKTSITPTDTSKNISSITHAPKAVTSAPKDSAKIPEKKQSVPETNKKTLASTPMEKAKTNQETAKSKPAPPKEISKKTPTPPNINTKKQQEELAALEAKQQLEVKEREKKKQAEVAALEIARQECAKASEKLGNISKKSQKSNSVSTELHAALPKEISSLKIDSFLAEGDTFTKAGKTEMTYLENVSYCLKKRLRLPDYGFVSIKLTIEKTGKVTRVEIVKSGSSLNKAYIEKELPKLIFSPFGSQFQGVDHYTFLITIHNE
jgi:hypothetical protein